ncbi:hypothetical protein Q7P35_002025 [Cladosporium inversicolor]
MHMQQALDRLPVKPVWPASPAVKPSQISKPTRTQADHQPSPDWPPKQSRPSPASRKTSSPAKGTLHYTPQTNSTASHNHHHAAHTPPASTRRPSPIELSHRNPRADTIEQELYGLKSSGHHGVQQWRARQPYKSFKSQYGPSYNIPKVKLGQYTPGALLRMGPIGAAFGASAGIFAIFFFDGIPRVQTDILQKVPFIGSFYHNEIAPEDNPF